MIFNRKQSRTKLPDIRNDKKHRDDRTHDNNLQLQARVLRIERKELGEYERALGYKAQI